MSAEMTLPEEWKTLKLEDLFVHIIGGDWGKDPEIEDENFVHVLCIRGTEFRSWNKERGASAVLRKIKQSSLSSRKLEIGDILIEISGGGPDQPVGRTVVIDDRALKQHKSKSIVCTNFIRLARPIAHVNPFYLNYYLTAFYMSGEVINYQGGSNNLRNLKFKEYSQITVSLPPLAEQHQIAQRLDELLAQVDTIKARLDAIPAILKRFRQSVLSAAVTGKLTLTKAELSDQEIISPLTIGPEIESAPLDWKWRKLTDLAILESGHTPRKSVPEYWENGDIPWISLQDIREAHGKIIRDTKFKPNTKGIENSSARLLPAGTVCFSRDISVGFTTIMGISMSTTQHFANWICKPGLSNRYLMYCFMAAKDHLTSSGQGTTVKTIYMPALKELMILVPEINIQHQIVEKIELLLQFADKLDEQLKQAQSRVNLLTQSILAKAFRGELTADWRDEHPELISGENSAEALLAKIQAAKAALEGKKKKGKTA